MGLTRILATFWVVTVCAHGASPLECVSKLRLPTYDSLARQAQITGEGAVKIQLGVDGEVAHQEILASHPLLERDLKRAVEQMHFFDRCAKQTLEFKFTFEFSGEPSRDKGLVITFEYPDHFVLSVSPPVVKVQIDD